MLLSANADAGSLRYIINASARGALKSTEKASNTAQFVYENDEINGYPCDRLQPARRTTTLCSVTSQHADHGHVVWLGSDC